MSQLPLFRLATEADDTPSARSSRLDPDSEQLLAVFNDSRLAQGAHPQSVRREVSQIRAVMREACAVDPSATLRALLFDLDLIARVLREPQAPITRSTGRTRLLAVQRFIGIIARRLGRDPAADLRTLDGLLPARRTIGWHTAGTIVAGAAGRRRRRGPTLDAADLFRLVDAASAGGGAHALRDRALVALHCFSGLRPEEIVRLRWEDLAADLTVSGQYALTATVERGDRRLHLLLPGPAAAEMEALAASVGARIEDLSGLVLCARGAPTRLLSYRAARDVLHDTCRRAGLPSVESAALRAACAHWLRSQGLSDHEVAVVMGLARVRGVDRQPRHHAHADRRWSESMLLRPR